MKLTIVTINYNNAPGLKKTLESVLCQTSTDFEYIIVDGASSDLSLQMISDKQLLINGISEFNGIPVTCISELDSGIYNAMNKGIRIAKGDYIQFLNSGDVLVGTDVIEQMLARLDNTFLNEVNKCQNPRLEAIPILYGNMLKAIPEGLLRDKGFAGKPPDIYDFYKGTLNHSPTFIKRTLFDDYGMYDESLRIVSDWKWYFQVIALNNVMPIYVDIDVTIFDMTGISTINSGLDKEERKLTLEVLLPRSVLVFFDENDDIIEQFLRVSKIKAVYKILIFIERIIFQFEKRKKYL